MLALCHSWRGSAPILDTDLRDEGSEGIGALQEPTHVRFTQTHSAHSQAAVAVYPVNSGRTEEAGQRLCKSGFNNETLQVVE